MTTRIDGRAWTQLRPIRLAVDFLDAEQGISELLELQERHLKL